MGDQSAGPPVMSSSVNVNGLSKTVQVAGVGSVSVSHQSPTIVFSVASDSTLTASVPDEGMSGGQAMQLAALKARW